MYVRQSWFRDLVQLLKHVNTTPGQEAKLDDVWENNHGASWGDITVMGELSLLVQPRLATETCTSKKKKVEDQGRSGKGRY